MRTGFQSPGKVKKLLSSNMKEMYKVIADFPVTMNLLDIFQNKQVLW